MIAAALLSSFLGSCARDCVISAAEKQGFGDHGIDCSDATAKHTGEMCGDVYEVVEVTGCRKKNGEIVNIELLVDTTSPRCFTRQLAGMCFL